MKWQSIRSLVLAATMVMLPASSFGGIFVSVSIAPPALPVYVQPVAPGPDYMWTPGYWAYGPDGYFWVPGTWVLAPTPGLLWTPGYWGWGGGVYLWHAGYWGPHVGFYGGVNYGFGYAGVGFGGGAWVGGHFSYNTAVMNVNTAVVHNTYVDKTVIVNNNTTINHTSYNGGQGGIAAQPTAQEAQYGRENHVAPTAMQTSHENAASTNRANFASVNHGNPGANAAMSRPMGTPHAQGGAEKGGPAPQNRAQVGAEKPGPNNANNANKGNNNSKPKAPPKRPPAAEHEEKR